MNVNCLLIGGGTYATRTSSPLTKILFRVIGTRHKRTDADDDDDDDVEEEEETRPAIWQRAETHGGVIP
ncbi:hypothetical protein RUM44_007987 [Polyplax serrata]|uniref:Uncharacterized protein n=1 Tax=Polyplax serrata TaxID=468196 RepID=A0ABR1B7I8_POLSC